ncbi:hypothetical protein [Aeromicrobium sp. UC242_57]|uniref:hypothetical protein n=1 Tax=Aeromicrobium sp. UC242_57 TaxID=3374624 RepID=UPI0037A77D99
MVPASVAADTIVAAPTAPAHDHRDANAAVNAAAISRQLTRRTVMLGRTPCCPG